MAEQDNTEQGLYHIYLTLKDKDFYLSSEDIEDFYFIEDIFSYSITGKIQFNDRYGILEFGPITGHEEINIVYGVEQDVERKFDIYKINKVMANRSSNTFGRDNYIEIIFVDKMFYSLSNSVYSTSWKEDKYSKVVKDVAEKALETEFEEFEKTNETFKIFTMPYWTPKQAIDWVIKRTSGSISGNPSYLFYNNSLGSNFITLDNLLSQSDLMTIDDKDDGIYKFKSKNLVDFNKILAFQLSGVDNHSQKELKGGHRLGFNFDEKRLIKKSFNYSNNVSQFNLLGRISLFEDISQENTSVINYGESDEKSIDNIYYNDWLKRYSHQQTLTIITHGHEERYAGGIIKIKWPSSDEEEMYNKNFDGKYLIKSIIHQFGGGKPKYRQKMILIKNAYEDSDNINLVKASKKNLGD